MILLFIFPVLVMIVEKKRRIYDQYGKEGLLGHNENNNYGHQRQRHHQHYDQSDFIFGFPFVFRDPEEVFREFFGGSPFDEMFFNTGGHSRRHTNGASNGGGSRHHHHHRQSHPQNVMSPFLSFSLMDDMFAPQLGMGGMNAMNGGFTSLSSFSNGGSHHGGGMGGGSVKRISTSTSFVNGKKVVTKK